MRFLDSRPYHIDSYSQLKYLSIQLLVIVIVNLLIFCRFEKVCYDVFDRISLLLEYTLQKAELTNKDISHIIFLGGSTKIPKIRELVINYIGKTDLSRTRLHFKSPLAASLSLLKQVFIDGFTHPLVEEENVDRPRYTFSDEWKSGCACGAGKLFCGKVLATRCGQLQKESKQFDVLTIGILQVSHNLHYMNELCSSPSWTCTGQTVP